MDPILVITNAAAGTADQETLDRGLAVLREHGSVEVAATGTLGELDSVLHRAGLAVPSSWPGATARCTPSSRHCTGGTTSTAPPWGCCRWAPATIWPAVSDIPLDVEEAALVVATGEPTRIDLVVDELGGVVVNSVHVGAGAEASRQATGWKHRLGAIGVGGLNLGKLGYPIGALTTAIRPPTLRLRVEIDGEVVNDLDQPVLMVAVGNGTSVGGGAPLTPDADVDDGRVDVMIARATGALKRVGYAARLARGTHPDHADVTYLRAKQVSVSGEEFWCSADGEIDGPDRHRTWHVEPAAYTVLLPA